MSYIFFPLSVLCSGFSSLPSPILALHLLFPLSLQTTDGKYPYNLKYHSVSVLPVLTGLSKWHEPLSSFSEFVSCFLFLLNTLHIYAHFSVRVHTYGSRCPWRTSCLHPLRAGWTGSWLMETLGSKLWSSGRAVLLLTLSHFSLFDFYSESERLLKFKGSPIAQSVRILLFVSMDKMLTFNQWYSDTFVSHHQLGKLTMM